MRLASFVSDALFDFDGRRYRLAAKVPSGGWQAVDVETGLLANWSWDDMTAAYEAGHLTLVTLGGGWCRREDRILRRPAS